MWGWVGVGGGGGVVARATSPSTMGYTCCCLMGGFHRGHGGVEVNNEVNLSSCRP